MTLHVYYFNLKLVLKFKLFKIYPKKTFSVFDYLHIPIVIETMKYPKLKIIWSLKRPEAAKIPGLCAFAQSGLLQCYINHINLYCPRFKFESDGGKSISVSITRLWNNVPSTIRSLPTLNSFKKSYRKLLSDSYTIILLILPYLNFLS